MKRLMSMLAAGLLCAAAGAQTADPTLPPPGLMPRAEGEPEPAPPAGPELQSVLVSREAGGRRIAVISGEMVRQGSRWRGALVERVGENEVVLRRCKAREVLRLHQPPATPARGREQQ